MKEIFDFGAIKELLTGSEGNPKLNVLINAMNGGKQFAILNFCTI